MADYKLIGKNYKTPDLVAKVTGKAKYAEDYRADGMLFCKLLLSPRPHARVTRIDASAALAMPGVHAVLTADDMPAPPPPPAPPAAPPAPAAQGGAVAAGGAVAPQAGAPAAGATVRRRPGRGAGHRHRAGRRLDTGARPASRRPRSRRPLRTPPAAAARGAAEPARGIALTKEPLYEGEPILALAADTEEIAADAIERIIVDYEPLPFVIDPLDSLRPGGPDGRTEGNVFVGANVETLKWTAADIAQVEAGKFPTNAEASETLIFGDVNKGFKEADLIIERDHNQQTTSHQPLETPHGDGLLAERQALPARLDAERGPHGRLGRGMGRHQAGRPRAHQRVHAAAASAARFRARTSWRSRRCSRRN